MKLPEVIQGPHPVDQVVRENDRAAKDNMKAYADTKARAKASLINCSTSVMSCSYSSARQGNCLHCFIPGHWLSPAERAPW